MPTLCGLDLIASIVGLPIFLYFVLIVLRWLPSQNQPKIEFFKIVWNQSFLDQNLSQISSQEKHMRQEVFDLIFYEVCTQVTYFSDFLGYNHILWKIVNFWISAKIKSECLPQFPWDFQDFSFGIVVTSPIDNFGTWPFLRLYF